MEISSSSVVAVATTQDESSSSTAAIDNINDETTSSVVIEVKATTETVLRKDDDDYVDPSLFSPEVSRHALDVAQNRARDLEHQLVEESKIALHNTRSTKLSRSFANRVGSLMNSFSKKQQRYTALDKGHVETDDDDDLEGDGIELSLLHNSPKAEQHSSVVDQLKSAMKKSSTSRTTTTSPVRLSWKEEDTTTTDDENNNDSSSAPHIEERRKKPGLRRLSVSEKEVLYKTRPDLHIIPNWAQKYRQDMQRQSNGGGMRIQFSSNTVLGVVILCLGIVLILCILLIILHTNKR